MAENLKMTQSEAKCGKRTRLSAALIFLVMPLTIVLGLYLGKDKFMVISLLILIYTMLPFFMVFERRKPKAREIVLIAMMSALTVTLRLFCHITSASSNRNGYDYYFGNLSGTGSGFLIGAVSRFVCATLYGTGTVDAMADVLLGEFWGFLRVLPLTRWTWMN